MHKNKNTTTMSAKYGEWITSLVGACVAAFALGALLSQYFSAFIWPMLVGGVLMHAWGMRKTYQRNR